jgi:hypothetical protein
MRKRVVEFDDVINKQRETIYAERDKVLRNEDLTDTVEAFLDEEIEALCDSHLSGSSEQWGMDALIEALKRMGVGPEDVTEDELWDLHSREAVAQHLREVVKDKLDTHEASVGEEWSMVERFVLLRTIDSLWVEHLTEIDDMRRGIGLRGYAQQDPLNEFRKEASSSTGGAAHPAPGGDDDLPVTVKRSRRPPGRASRPPLPADGGSPARRTGAGTARLPRRRASRPPPLSGGRRAPSPAGAAPGPAASGASGRPDRPPADRASGGNGPRGPDTRRGHGA